MKQAIALTALLGFTLMSSDSLAEESKTSPTSTSPILCGVSPKSKNLIHFAATRSEDNESLDLLLEALTPKQYQRLKAIINRGSLEELIQIEGIAEGRAEVIMSARPYREVKELMLNRGFGYATVASVIMHGSTLESD